MSLIKKLRDGKVILNQNAKESGQYTELSGELLISFQSVLLEMYLDLKEACDKHGCKAFLCGGSALGCVRHGGFIPWDDDFDVAMSRSDYNKLKVFFEEELGSKYLLNAPDISKKPVTRFPKIFKKESKLISYGGVESEYSKIYIDIFLIENIPEQRTRKTVKGLCSNFFEFASAQVEFYRAWDHLKNVYLSAGRGYAYFRKIIGAVFSLVRYETWLKWIDKQIQYDDSTTTLCGLPTGRKHYFGEILPRSVFFPGKTGLFCGHEVDMFEDVEAYLTNLYGADYMTPPPENKREHHYITEIRL